MATVVTDKTFKNEVLTASMPVMVDFYAEWCGPCKMMAPVVEELGKKYEGKVKIAKVNVDENMDTAQNYGIMSIPTFVFFKGGKEAGERVTGAMAKETLAKKLDELL